MADLFEPSPRASKRRKATYSVSRSILREKYNEKSDDVSARDDDEVVDNQDSKKQKYDFDDSTYGSKDDILMENNESSNEIHAVSNESANETIDTSPAVKRTQLVQSKKRGNKNTAAPKSGSRKTTNANSGKKSSIEGVDASHKAREVTPSSAITEPEEKTLKEDSTLQTRSSGRERRRPRRFSISPEKPKSRRSLLVDEARPKEVVPESPRGKDSPAIKAPPKGILTPSRKEKRIGPRKSVVFDQDEQEIGEQLGFRDIDDSTEKKSRTQRTKSKKGIISTTTEPVTKLIKQPQDRRVEPSSRLEDDNEYDETFEPATFDHYEPEPPALEPEEVPTDGLELDDNPSILTIKSEVLSRLTSRDGCSVPPHLQNQYDSLHSLLHATIASGESNSLLLLGARGSGKTHILDTAVSELSKEYVDDFHTVRLSGFLQTDDKVALREIWRQLGREMQVSEMETGEIGGSYADTMASLLSLLSHPDEFGEPVIKGNLDPMQLDSEPVRTSKSIIFVLDEFDLFTTHPRQTLLYNLFDIAQSRKAPIAVIGCSTRMDVVESLEKRVKSRFSHRWLHIPAVKTLVAFEQMVKDVLCVEEKGKGFAATKISENEQEARRTWNEYVQSCLLPSPEIQTLIKQTFYTTKSLPELLTRLFIPVATLKLPRPDSNSAAPSSPSSSERTLYAIGTSPSLLTFLPNLSTLHLTLLIAAARLDTIHSLNTMNFNLVYAHYTDLISRSKLQMTAAGAVAVGASLRQWSRTTARSAWEDLGSYEVVVPVSGGGVGTGAGGVMGLSATGGKDAGGLFAGGVDAYGGEGANVRMWRVDVTLDELAWAVREKWTEHHGVGGSGARDLLGKWCREI